MNYLSRFPIASSQLQEYLPVFTDVAVVEFHRFRPFRSKFASFVAVYSNCSVFSNVEARSFQIIHAYRMELCLSVFTVSVDMNTLWL